MITKLFPESHLNAIRDEWIAIGLATGPDDIELRDRSIDLAYQAARLEPPKIRIELRSPLEGVIGAFMLAQVWDQVGAQIGDQIRAQVWAQVRDQIRDQVGAQIGDQIRDQVWDQVGDQVGDQVRAQVWDQIRDQVWAQVGDQIRDQVGDQVGDQVRAQVNRAGYGVHDANWLAFYATFRDELPERTTPLIGLWGLCRSTGWWWAFRGAVIFTPRPSEIHLSSGRLHNDSGPALRYPDGFSLYRLNGVSVPDWLAITPKDKIDPRKIFEINNAEVRREFVRKVGIEAIAIATKAQVISASGLYELLSLDLGDGRVRPYLRMQNPSIDATHLEGVHPNCKTVQDALNYRNHLESTSIDDESGAEWYQQGDVILRPREATRFKSRPKLLT